MLFQLFLFGLLASTQVSACDFEKDLNDITQSILEADKDLEAFNLRVKDKLDCFDKGLENIFNAVKEVVPDFPNEVLLDFDFGAKQILGKVKATSNLIEDQVSSERKSIVNIVNILKSSGLPNLDRIVTGQKLKADRLVNGLKSSLGDTIELVDAKKVEIDGALNKIDEESLFLIKDQLDNEKFTAKKIKAELRLNLHLLNSQVWTKKHEIENNIKDWKDELFNEINENSGKQMLKQKIMENKDKIASILNELNSKAFSSIDEKIQFGNTQADKLVIDIDKLANSVDEKISEKLKEIKELIDERRNNSKIIISEYLEELKHTAEKETTSSCDRTISWVTS